MNPVEVVVDADSGLAPWRQVHDQLVRLISTGALPAGARLPTIRQFARDLGLAPGTIARTYRELELAGLVQTGRAKGTVVAETTAIDPAAALRDLARDYAGAAHALGVDATTAADAVHAAYDEAATHLLNRAQQHTKKNQDLLRNPVDWTPATS